MVENPRPEGALPPRWLPPPRPLEQPRTELTPISDWEQKVWGVTRCDLMCPQYSKHTLRTEAGGVCSVHYHLHRCNRFHVISGRIAVVELYGWQVKRTVLGKGAELEVPSLVPHQFQSLVNSQVIEEYWPDRGGQVLVDDIVRLSIGCKVEPKLLYDAKHVVVAGKVLEALPS